MLRLLRDHGFLLVRINVPGSVHGRLAMRRLLIARARLVVFNLPAGAQSFDLAAGAPLVELDVSGCAYAARWLSGTREVTGAAEQQVWFPGAPGDAQAAYKDWSFRLLG